MAATPEVLERIEARKQEVARDGFTRFQGKLDPALVEKAYQELEQMFAEARRNPPPPHEMHQDATMQLAINIFGKCPAFDQLFEQILTDPEAKAVLEWIGGKNLKLRGYNVRRMTGVVENSDMEWHRDNLLEIGWSIAFTDVEPEGDGATGLVPGSHLYPYCPREKCLFPYRGYKGLKFFQKFNIFNKLLARRTIAKATCNYGKKGDFVIFINDMWHSRQKNTNRKNTIISLVGVFPAEAEFPDKVEIPPDEILDKLPPNLRRIVDYRNTPPNPDRSAYIYRMLEERMKERPLSLWQLARWERCIADVLSVWLRAAGRMIATLGGGFITTLRSSLRCMRVVVHLPRRALGLGKRLAKRILRGTTPPAHETPVAEVQHRRAA